MTDLTLWGAVLAGGGFLVGFMTSEVSRWAEEKLAERRMRDDRRSFEEGGVRP